MASIQVLFPKFIYANHDTILHLMFLQQTAAIQRDSKKSTQVALVVAGVAAIGTIAQVVVALCKCG